MRHRTETACKALLLIGLALFLYSRLANGTLLFYINQRFSAFTLLAVVGLLLVGLSYRFTQNANAEDASDSHGQQDHASHHHSPGLTWGGVALVLLPVVLGLLVPPQPLGASALANREINSGLNSTTMPGLVGAAAQKSTVEKNLLDWWQTFRTSAAVNQDPAIIGQPVRVVGFVYQDDRYGAGHFMLVRYIVSCCVADASALGLVVASADAANLASDQWVEVSGHFTASTLDSWQMPVLVADAIQPVAVPDHPYLYP